MLLSVKEESNPTGGLILTGGGARAAYQVGVLKAFAERLGNTDSNPFPVITGTSAGSINAALLAANAQSFKTGVNNLVGLWENLTVDRIFRTDVMTMLGTSFRWFRWLLLGRRPDHAPRSMLDSSPLQRLLEKNVNFSKIQEAIDCGALHALGITASGYTSARSVTFFQGRHGLVSWSRTRRDGRMANVELEHIMASAAIPLIFPAERIGPEYFGDGSMRQAAPLSPAIHLGADRLLVIGVRNEDPNILPPDTIDPGHPSFGQIIGYVLDTLFMDALYTDVERLRRINSLLTEVNENRFSKSSSSLRPIDISIIVPSEDIRAIATRYIKRFPRTVRNLLRILGAKNDSSNQLISYLMFDGMYCQELIELGYHDGMQNVQVLDRYLAGLGQSS